MYLLVRKSNFGEILQEQENALREELLSLSEDEKEQIAIVKKATAGGYKSFFKQGKGRTKSSSPKTGAGKKAGFKNFQERQYDMSELERKLVERNENRRYSGKDY